MSNVSRTMDYYRSLGYEVWIVERYIYQAKKKFDLFGIIDLIAIAKNEIIGIQVCGSDYSSHEKKIEEGEYTKLWLESGARLVLIGWRKLKLKRGGKAMRWKPRLKEYKINDFK